MPKRTYRSKEDWKRLIEMQRESGLSAAEFCRRQGINAKYFSRRKAAYLRLADEPGASPAFIKIQPPVQTTSSTGLDLHYKNARLHIPPDVSPAWLAGLLGLLP